MLIENFYQSARYISTSIVLYFYVFFGLWICVEKFGFDDFFSYIVIYSSVYLINYLVAIKWVFKLNHRKIVVTKYLIYLATFLVIHSLVYKTIKEHLYFMNAAIIAAVILFPLRYISSKLFVFK